jgi:hypothetical protein
VVRESEQANLLLNARRAFAFSSDVFERPIVANRIAWAFLKRLARSRRFVGCCWLAQDDSLSDIVVATEHFRRGAAAHIAIYAGGVDVKPAGNIL